MLDEQLGGLVRVRPAVGEEDTLVKGLSYDSELGVNDIPKSAIAMCPSHVTRMLLGLRSQWTMRWSWSLYMARACIRQAFDIWCNFQTRRGTYKLFDPETDDAPRGPTVAAENDARKRVGVIILLTERRGNDGVP